MFELASFRKMLRLRDLLNALKYERVVGPRESCFGSLDESLCHRADPVSKLLEATEMPKEIRTSGVTYVLYEDPVTGEQVYRPAYNKKD